MVIQQDEKSQHKNRAKAMKVLRARLYDLEREKLDAERAQDRRSQIGSGDRSQRIRTYNFPQGRVTDHRIGLTTHQLHMVLEGETALDEVIDALTTEDQTSQLAAMEEARREPQAFESAQALARATTLRHGGIEMPALDARRF